MFKIVKQALTALLIAKANADVNSDPNQDQAFPNELNSLLRTFSSSKNMLAEILQYHGTDEPHKEAKNLIRNYGCYCYPDGSKVATSRFNYHGPALDPLDNLCREVFFRQKCFEIDAKENLYGEGVECKYEKSYNWFFDEDTGEIQCGKKNNPGFAYKKPCNANNCAIERDFAHQVAALYLDSSFSSKLDYKNMDDDTYQVTCVSQPKAVEHELKCCGSPVQTYDKKTGVQTVNFDRRMYNSLVSECCDDGTVAFAGACP